LQEKVIQEAKEVVLSLHFISTTLEDVSHSQVNSEWKKLKKKLVNKKYP
jgi:hypothetical protein